MNLRISNLSASTSAADIIAHFRPFQISFLGRIYTIANVPKTEANTYCFISISDPASGAQAIAQYNGSLLLDNAITVVEGK